MLQFLRKHQRVLFVFITVVIVITFSFFGTGRSASPGVTLNQRVAFVTVDGKAISSAELIEMTRFLATDSQDAMTYRGQSGLNFLNDGVIAKDFLSTGLAQILVNQYFPMVESGLKERAEKELRYQPYSHPQVKFISSDMAWKFFAPELRDAFLELKNSDGKSLQEQFNTKVNLYLEHRDFGPSMLKQVLQYQENQYQWISPDPYLASQDLALFNHHSLEDWFGPRFTELVSQFIFNAAAVAEKWGYEVTYDEARLDLLRNSEVHFRQNEAIQRSGIHDSSQLFSDFLYRIGIDEGSAVQLWQKVLLFRRFFHEMGNGVFEAPLVYNKFNAYANASVEANVYQLPHALRLSNYNDLQKFQVYLDCVAPPMKETLSLPETTLPLAEIEKKHPSLIEQHYKLEIAHVPRGLIESNIPVKETWNWELELANWEELAKSFPVLASASLQSREERYKLLQSQKPETRQKIDQLARSLAVSQHPEWIDEALNKAKSKTMELDIRSDKQTIALEGISDIPAFVALLDRAAIAPEKSVQELLQYTDNEEFYYRVSVLEKGENKTLLTFAKANSNNVLDPILQQRLTEYYEKIRDNEPEVFQTETKDWKPFEMVEREVADRLFAKVLDAVSTYMLQVKGFEDSDLTAPFLGAFCAAHRFYPYLAAEKQRLQSDSVAVEQVENSLTAQWTLIEKHRALQRHAKDSLPDEELFALSAGTWSRIMSPNDGDLKFYHILTTSPGKGNIIDNVLKGQALLSADVQRLLMLDLLDTISEKNAIAFEESLKVEEVNT